MSPPAGVNAQLRHLVYYNLDNGLLENALFYAGRLHALEPRSADAAHLLALCNLRLGRYKAAYDYAKPKSHQTPHLGCAYVFAQACLGLERYDIGAQALEKARSSWAGRNSWNKHSDTSRRHLPDAAACYCLLGKLYSARDDSKKAIDNYVEALKLNSLMWDAYIALCDMGAVVRPANVFKITPDILASISHLGTNANGANNPPPSDSFDSRNPFVATPELDPFNPSVRPGADVGLNHGGPSFLSKLNGNMPVVNGNGVGSTYPDIETPTSNGQNMHDGDVMMAEPAGVILNEHGMEMPHAPARKTRLQAFSASDEPPKMRPITSRTRLKTASENHETTDIPRPIGQNGHKRTVSGHSMQHAQHPNAPTMDPTAAPPRRSVRLLNSISQIRPSGSRLAAAASKDPEAKERRELRKMKATGTKGKSGTVSTVGRVVSGNRKPAVEISESLKPDSRPTSAAAIGVLPPRMAAPVDPAREQDALNWLLELLYRIGSGYQSLTRFECMKALEAFNAVPAQQRETPWVLAQIGKAYYECSKYADAEKVFQRIRDKAPSHMEDMEVYSNTLWFLKKETDLAYLAHTLVDQDRLSPQAWCTLGNAFSLQGEHDRAINCFTRATQLDPKFAYAYTLQGHEHVTNEEYEKATQAYRLAMQADGRHYNSYYGLASVYEKMGKFDFAERHYRMASQINPSNPLLAIKTGIVLERMKKLEPALLQYEAAARLDPRSNQARFRKANIHLKLGSPEEALKDVLAVKDVAPEDVNVHFLLGRIYKSLRDRTNAIRHFTIALNLDPKAQQYIKEHMEGFDDEDVSGWSSGADD